VSAKPEWGSPGTPICGHEHKGEAAVLSVTAHYATKRAEGEIEAPPVSTEDALATLEDD
jgi:hypothetical protein